MIHGEAALTHHLFEVAAGELVPAIPTDAQKNKCGFEMAPFERGLMLLQEYDSRWVIAELGCGL